MAVKTVEELLEQLKSKLGDDTSDESIALVEDITDTMKDLSTKQNDGTDWKTKFEENDTMWRKRYHDRFFSSPSSEEEDPLTKGLDSSTEPLTFDKLFKED